MNQGPADDAKSADVIDAEYEVKAWK